MATDLGELLARIEHCRPKIAALEKEVERFIQENFLFYQFPTDETSNNFDVFIFQKNEITLSLRSETGMIINEFRTILDAVACSLAIRNGRSTATTYFPICKTQHLFEKHGRKKISALSLIDQAAIESLQPWDGGHTALWRLHEADIQRKHRNLLACNGRSGGISVSQSTGANITIFPEGMRIPPVRVPFRIAAVRNNCMPINLNCHAPTVVFGEPPCMSNIPLIEALNIFSNCVQSIVKMF